jgi:hypothetical protein
MKSGTSKESCSIQGVLDFDSHNTSLLLAFSHKAVKVAASSGLVLPSGEA